MTFPSKAQQNRLAIFKNLNNFNMTFYLAPVFIRIYSICFTCYSKDKT